MARPKSSLHFPAVLVVSVFLSACAGGGNGGGGGGGGNGPVDLVFANPTTTLSLQAGSNGTITFVVQNKGSQASSGSTTVTFPLTNNGNPTGVTFNATGSGGTGWDCSASTSTNVSCATSASIGPGASAPTLTVGLSVSTTATAFPTQPTIINAGDQGGQIAHSYTLSVTVVIAPRITSLTPNSGSVGTSVVIAGANFGSTQGTSTVTFNGVSAGTASTWSATRLTVTVPVGASTGNVVVTVAGVASSGVTFTVTAAGTPNITGLSPTSGPVGTAVTITGTNFGATQGTSTVTFNGVSAGTASAWSATSITVMVPNGGTTGNLVVTVAAVASNGVAFTVIVGCPLGKLGNESLLNGTYTALFSGWADRPVSATEAVAAFQVNGAGLIASGEIDAGAVAIAVAQGVPVHTTFTGCFNLGTDQRGLMIWNSALGQSIALAFAVSADGSQGRFIESDDADPSATPGNRGAGFFEKQLPVTTFNAPVAFELTGYSPNGSDSDYHRSAVVGVISNIVFGSATPSNGTADVAFTNDGTGTQTNVDNQTFSATVGNPDALGRGAASLVFANFSGIGALTLNFAYYRGAMFNSAARLFLQSTDTPDNMGHSLQNGEADPQTGGSFGPGSLLASAIVQMTGADLSASHNHTDIAVGRIQSDGAGNTTVNLDEVSNGSQVAVGTNAISGGAFTVSANGLGSIRFGTTRFFSLAMIGQNAGFILEGTGANPPSPGHILVGDLAPQSPAPQGFFNANFSGSYAIGDDHPASTSSDNLVGSITADPNAAPSPSFSGKTDSSSGPPCADNCLLYNQTTTATYSVDYFGRVTVTFISGGSGTTVGWFVSTAPSHANFDFLSDTSGMDVTILKLIQ